MSLGDLYERRGAWPRGANTLHNGFANAGLAMLSTALVTSAVSAPLPTQSREFGSSIILRGAITRSPKGNIRVHPGVFTSDERFRVLVEGISDYAIYMLDPNGVITTWNPGAQRFKGYTEQEIIGCHFSRFYTEDAKV